MTVGERNCYTITVAGGITFLFSSLLLAFNAPGFAATGRWHESVSPNFIVRHESSFMPPGLLLELGKMHGRLRLDLSMFSPWMAKERIHVYLYSTAKSYVAGEFKPPAWSNGVAYSERKLIATHEQAEKRKLIAIMSHEMTHLLFESYWAEEKKSPPVWINEGLAMMEEAVDPKLPEDSDWHRSMWVLSQARPLRLKNFFAMNPTRDMMHAQKEQVSHWYVQAYSLVYFLYRKHTRMQFRSFCGMLRDGKSLEQSLWKAYRYASVDKLEAAWRKWLALPELQEKIRPHEQPRAAASVKAPASDGESKRFKNVGFKHFYYHSLVPER
ncbi:MAG: hypothetical protein ABIJ96_12480 [Elusimicrobiota bacterium]